MSLGPSAQRLYSVRAAEPLIFILELTQKTYNPAEERVEITAVGGHDGLLLSSLCLHKETGHFPDQNLGQKERRHTLYLHLCQTDSEHCVIKDSSASPNILSVKCGAQQKLFTSVPPSASQPLHFSSLAFYSL